MKDGTPSAGGRMPVHKVSRLYRKTRQVLSAHYKGFLRIFACCKRSIPMRPAVFTSTKVSWCKPPLPAMGRCSLLTFTSAYLAYPLHEMHGSVQAGLLTLSRYEIAQGNTGAVTRLIIASPQSFLTLTVAFRCSGCLCRAVASWCSSTATCRLMTRVVPSVRHS